MGTLPAAALGYAHWKGLEIAGLMGWAGGHLPHFALSLPAFVNALSLGAVSAAGVASLYGFGRLHSHLWDWKKTGIWGNLARGALLPAGLPLWALHRLGIKFPKYLYGKTKAFAQRQVEGVKRIFTGSSPTVKFLTSPVWWPIRSSYNLARGVVKGAYNGITNSAPSETDRKQWFFGKIGRGVGLPVGKAIASPYRLGKWLLSETWPWDKK